MTFGAILTLVPGISIATRAVYLPSATAEFALNIHDKHFRPPSEFSDGNDPSGEMAAMLANGIEYGVCQLRIDAGRPELTAVVDDESHGGELPVDRGSNISYDLSIVNTSYEK